MKTSVKNIMMSFALMGCLIFSASDAMAQGRSRSQGGSTASRSQSAAVSRNNNSAAPTVSRASSSSSMSRSSEAMPQVNRSSSSSSVQRSTTSPQVNRGSSTNTSAQRSTTSPQVNRGSSSSSSSSSVSTGNRGTSRPSGTTSGSSSVNRGSSSSTKIGSSVSTADTRRDNSKMVGNDARGTATTRDRISTTTQSTNSSKDRVGHGGKPGGNGHVDNDKNGKDRHNGGKPGGNGNVGNNNHGNDRPNGNRPGGHGNHDGHGKPNGYGGNGNHFDYHNHHYHNDYHNNYSHHSWSWSRPLPPPVRPYRPIVYEWYRPVIPYGWAPYAGAPVIDRILGLAFGSLFDTSIEYLYYNGYEIDGYADHIIYLRNVMLLNNLWDDVMLSFDGSDRLVNAQFVYHSSSYNNYRYRRIYNSLTRVYGAPITSDSRGISWYGGGCTGWITLSTNVNLGHHYMTLSIGY